MRSETIYDPRAQLLNVAKKRLLRRHKTAGADEPLEMVEGLTSCELGVIIIGCHGRFL
jgi:D-aminopeptidase